MATLTGKSIATTYDQLWFRSTTEPSGTTGAVNVLTTENDGTDDLATPLYLGTERIGIGTASPEGILHLYSETTGRPWITIEHKGSAGEQSGTLYFKTRETGVNAHLNDDVVIGNIEFSSYDGTDGDYLTSAMIRSFAKATQAQNQAGGNLTFWTNNDTTSAVQRMVIDETGNVGIGTTTPDTLLELTGAAADVGSTISCHSLAPINSS